MPDTSPSQSFLRRLGLIPQDIPADIPPAQRRIRDAEILKQQSQDPMWKQAVRGGIDAGSGLVKGFMGMDPADDASNSEYAANALMQLGGAAAPLAKAGLPFLAMTKGKPALHGTGRVFDYFDPKYNDPNDLLGRMHHAAGPRDYGYADSYVQGKSGIQTGARENVIPIVPKANNVLDLFSQDLNPDDMSAAIAAVPNDYRRRALIDNWKDKVRTGSPTEHSNFVNMLQSYLNKEDVAPNLPFDAIRYSDIGYEAYAIPHTTPMETPWGTPLNKTAKPIDIVKLPNNLDTGSSLTYHQPSATTEAPAIVPRAPKGGSITYLKDKPAYGYGEDPWETATHVSPKPSKPAYQWEPFDNSKYPDPYAGKSYKPEPSVGNSEREVHHPDFGYIDEKEAGQLYSAGEISSKWWDTHFGKSSFDNATNAGKLAAEKLIANLNKPKTVGQLLAEKSAALKTGKISPIGPQAEANYSSLQQVNPVKKPQLMGGPSYSDPNNVAYSFAKGKSIIEEAKKLGIDTSSHKKFADIELEIVNKIFSNWDNVK